MKSVKFIEVRDGTRLSAYVSGSGQDLMLISGLGGTGAFWDPVIDALGSGLRTATFDHRGLGASRRGTGSISIKTLAQDAWDLIDALEMTNPVLCGLSMGGAIVQEMALMRPGGSPAIMMNGTWAGPNELMATQFNIRLKLLGRSPVKYAEFSTLLGSPARWLNDHPDILERARSTAPVGALAPLVRDRIHALLAHDCRSRLAEIDVPTLIAGAEDDQIVPVYLQEELAAGIGHSRLHIFQSGGHFFPVSQLAEFVNLVREWLRELDLV